MVDQDRYRDIRYSDAVDRIVKGGRGADTEAAKIGRRFGADIFVTGEAFTQVATDTTEDIDGIRVRRLQCRARVELRAVRVDTAERIYSDAAQRTGAPDVSEELASKVALAQTAEVMAERLLSKLEKLAFGVGQHIELEIRGVPSVAVSSDVEKAISKLQGVVEVSPGTYETRIYRTEVLIARSALREFAAKLTTVSNLKRFRLKILSATGSRIVAQMR